MREIILTDDGEILGDDIDIMQIFARIDLREISVTYGPFCG